MIDYDLVNSFIGRPWVYLEFDCWSLVKQASKLIFGVEIIDGISFSKSPGKGDTAILVSEQKDRHCWVKTDDFTPGDVVVFSDRKDNPAHIGICIEGKNVLHCMGGHGVKNGKARYDNINVVKLIYPNYESYRYVNHNG